MQIMCRVIRLKEMPKQKKGNSLFKSILLVLAFIFSKLKKFCFLFMRIIFYWIYLKEDYIIVITE